MASRDPSTTPAEDRNGASGKKDRQQIEMNNMASPQPQMPIEEDLMGLARLGELRAIQKLFDSGKYNANSADEQGITALHWAAINGHYALCHFLIQAGANVNAKGGDAEATPILWASKKCNLDIVNLLLHNGADPLIADDQGYNLLHCATLDGNVFQLVLLLHEAEIPVDVPDSQGHTSLMWAAYKGYPACVDVLLRWGADVHARDQQGFTALHWALVKGAYGCIQKLVEYGADRALADSGFDAAGNPREFPLAFVKDRRKFLSRFFFCWPFVVLGVSLYILSNFWVYVGVPMSLIVSYALQWLAQQLLRWAPSDMKHMHKTPFLAGVFVATLLWVGIRWITHILPVTWSSYFLMNLFFAMSFGLTTYFYVMCAFTDPGYIPKSGSRGQQKAVIGDLLQNKIFDERHFCTACMIRKPLRSKHCGRCKRCVAREDHHCPWVDNCVGVNNHRHFVQYLIFLAIGIALIIRLTLAYLSLLPAPTNLDCAILRPDLCAEFSKDTFTLWTNIWGGFQLIWVALLLFVQLTQVARAMTTYESMSGNRDAGPLTTALVTGSTSPEGGQVDASGGGPEAGAQGGARRRKEKKEGCWAQWKKLLGLDTFIATALHGSRAAEVQARRRQNPFTRGVVRNCLDFWVDGGGFGEGEGERDGRVGR
ncbi:palmitoyltransferase akr1 [Taxawa tesnikishii (nom. ined.)]|nr:palmitoyltransferase akr1 [Dothideales sp. JES 119]